MLNPYQSFAVFNQSRPTGWKQSLRLPPVSGKEGGCALIGTSPSSSSTSCKKMTVAHKMFTVHRPPNVLTIHLKRFVYFAQQVGDYGDWGGGVQIRFGMCVYNGTVSSTPFWDYPSGVILLGLSFWGYPSGVILLGL